MMGDAFGVTFSWEERRDRNLLYTVIVDKCLKRYGALEAWLEERHERCRTENFISLVQYQLEQSKEQRQEEIVKALQERNKFDDQVNNFLSLVFAVAQRDSLACDVFARLPPYVETWDERNFGVVSSKSVCEKAPG